MGLEVGPDSDSNGRSLSLFDDGGENEGMRDIDRFVEGVCDILVVVVTMAIRQLRAC